MTCTYEKAINDIFTAFTTAWNAGGALAACGYVPVIRYQGLVYNTPPDPEQFFARISTQMVKEGVAAVGGLRAPDAGAFGLVTNPTDGTTYRKYRSDGNAIVQLFGPLTGPQAPISMQTLRTLSSLVLTAFRGQCTPYGVWFRDCSRKELGQADNFERLQVTAQFTFWEYA